MRFETPREFHSNFCDHRKLKIWFVLTIGTIFDDQLNLQKTKLDLKKQEGKTYLNLLVYNANLSELLPRLARP